MCENLQQNTKPVGIKKCENTMV